MKAPISHLKDPDLQKVPQALLRAAEKARQLAEQTGTPFVVRRHEIGDDTEMTGDNKLIRVCVRQ
ncbi:MAG: hypothetical protein KGZ83_01225 [Sulfuricella sp.]|nr:hypothetical protein [Sulfuricella sp.]